MTVHCSDAKYCFRASLLVRVPDLFCVSCVPHTGPAGCGKSTTVEVLAKELGFQLVEWAPSTHTTWSEARYQVRGALHCTQHYTHTHTPAVRRAVY